MKPEVYGIIKGPRAGQMSVIVLERTKTNLVALDERGPPIGHATPLPQVDVMTYNLAESERWFEPRPKDPVELVAKIYLEHAVSLGASERAMDALAKLTKVTPEQRQEAIRVGAATTAPFTVTDHPTRKETQDMATTDTATKPAKGAKPAATPTTTKPAAAAKATPAKAAIPAKAAPAKPATAPAKAAPAKPAAATAKATPAAKPAADKVTASSVFKDLIMAGKLTDDQIFAEVKKQFGLDDSKRSYVAWYRNDLRKKGFNPPAAKV